jgi:perosamine synthetase
MVNSGTAALHLALSALDLAPGDEVIVPSFTFVASIQAIILSGAKPVFSEVCDDTLTIDLNDVNKRITNRTRVIMPVHYGGSVCEMDQIINLAARKNLKVVEDAAHAFGSMYKGRMVGTLGDITCFSFDPIKNITCGDGGAIVTNNDEIAEKARLKRYLGITRSSWQRASSSNNWMYEVVTEGYRYHMNDMHAAIGLAQLEQFHTFKARKLAIVRRYDDAFELIPGIRLIKRNLKEIFPFGYFIRVLNNRRDNLIMHLKRNGIETRVQFIPNHLHPAFSRKAVQLPVTEQIFKEIVTLPLYFEMKDAEIDKVIASVYSFFGKCGPASQQIKNTAKKLPHKSNIVAELK